MDSKMIRLMDFVNSHPFVCLVSFVLIGMYSYLSVIVDISLAKRMVGYSLIVLCTSGSLLVLFKILIGPDTKKPPK